LQPAFGAIECFSNAVNGKGTTLNNITGGIINLTKSASLLAPELVKGLRDDIL